MEENEFFPFIFPLEGETEVDYNRIMQRVTAVGPQNSYCASGAVLAGQHLMMLTIEQMIEDGESSKADALYLIQRIADQMMNYVRNMPDKRDCGVSQRAKDNEHELKELNELKDYGKD